MLSSLFVAALAASAARPAAAAGSPAVLAKYYAWFDENSWDSRKLSDQPVTPYRSAERATIERHVAQAQNAGIDGFQLNWWGPDNPTDTNLQTLLAVARAKGFKVSVDVDLNSPFMPGAGEVTAALRYLNRYLADPAWFRYDGRPVVSFYSNRRLDVGTWGAIRSSVGGDALWIAEGDIFGYLQVFDGIHPYSVAWSPNPGSQLASYASRTRATPGKLWVATVMPGYDDTRLGRGTSAFAVDRAGGGYYTRLWQAAIATQPAFITITSFNEWLEGSQIEPSKSYGELYIGLTRQMADTYRAGAAPPPPSRPPPPPATDGVFFTEAGQGKGGFGVTNRDGIGFWTSFQSLGGVDALAYPASQRFERGGFVYQATQGAVLQWRAELGRAVLANIFEWFTDGGKDDWLAETAGVPRPIRDDGSNGDWERAKATRLSWLTDPAIRDRYMAAGSLERALELYGLPMSRPERRGAFIVQRFQRIAFQHWLEPVAGMPPPGSVVRILGGDLLKQAGMLPAEATVPSAQ